MKPSVHTLEGSLRMQLPHQLLFGRERTHKSPVARSEPPRRERRAARSPSSHGGPALTEMARGTRGWAFPAARPAPPRSCAAAARPAARLERGSAARWRAPNFFTMEPAGLASARAPSRQGAGRLFPPRPLADAHVGRARDHQRQPVDWRTRHTPLGAAAPRAPRCRRARPTSARAKGGC